MINKNNFLFVSLLFASVVIFSGCSKDNNVRNPQDVNKDTVQENKNNTNVAPDAAVATENEDLPIWPEQKYSVEDYEGWKTYVNEKLGYKIKYPADWSINACDKGCTTKEVIINPPNAEMFTSYVSILINNDYTVEEIRKGFIDKNGSNSCKEEIVVFNNTKAFHYFDGRIEQIESIVFSSNGNNFLITTQKNSLLEVLQSLASFEFI